MTRITMVLVASTLFASTPKVEFSGVLPQKSKGPIVVFFPVKKTVSCFFNC